MPTSMHLLRSVALLERRITVNARAIGGIRENSDASLNKRRGRARESLLRRNLAPLSPPTPAPAQEPYNPLTVSLVKGVGRVMGYNFVRSKAIKVTGDLYDRCATRAQAEAHFWYKECALPASFQTWFQLTNLHIFLLLSRFRALPKDEAQTYAQELVNHFFIDTESRMRERFGVQTSRLVKGYMKDLHLQHRGSMIAYDEGLATDNVRLSGAVWRNVWGGGWGAIGGVKRKTPIDKTKRGDDTAEEGRPELAIDKDALQVQDALPDAFEEDRAARAEILFPQHLERVTRWLRREIYRLGHLPDETIIDGDVHAQRSTELSGGEQPVVSAYTRI
ncbi:beta-ketoacyl-[acyl-carrier-protein] synthase II [Malassezia vespertilionis]|uniref:Cbp3p n=1 Tax=Malassezia vespertilionis TaxID=2020962 RepID=A0A2N1JGM6_9BASI|nr:beta-ketoacyl-[acyl-carrier-protein] synthase II [Malassezia vespertilionis]PKI85685.1 Cbp3p [Malassezia vespertilionis]WFD05356.1 beta-ketoacyl-[acyl-carrier-protein] synthase II [Malassezia vespertilionis]